MKETPRRRITVTSSLNKMFRDQLGKKMVMRVKELLRPTPPTLFCSRLLNKYFKTT
jgi:hypothetical protein